MPTQVANKLPNLQETYRRVRRPSQMTSVAVFKSD